MSIEVKNGVTVTKSGRKVSAPTPAEIAGMAHDRAAMVAYDYIAASPLAAIGAHERLKERLEGERPRQLAALRESIINPPVIRGAH